MISNRSKNAGLKELKIFDNFIVDKTLPKFVNEKNKKGLDEPNTVVFANNTFNVDSSTGTPLNNAFISIDSNGLEPSEEWGVSFIDSNGNKFGFWKKIFMFFTINSLIKKVEDKKKLDNLMSIRDYFLNFSDSFNELTPLADIANHYEKAIVQASKLGQKSLVEKLTDMLDVVRGEAHLIQMGLTKYVTNEQVCDFYESVDEEKDLKLTWIGNFVKIIPEEVVGLKTSIDKRGVFDNYVILHFDPFGTATSLTKEELEVKKDPILFGLIKNSKRLYYVGDWKDDYCDLTIEGMFETLGEKTLEINNRNLKTYISKSGEYEQKRKKIK